MVECDVRSAIDTVVRERLDMIRVVSVTTERDEDFDGDEVLRVTVVVDSPASDFDIKRLTGLVRHIRARLIDVRETAFPLVNFMSKQDSEARPAL